jgi:serine/threonine-protein kinase
MGEVYRATDSVLSRTVAVKLLADRYACQDEARARFRREALAAARLSATPNVVTVFDVGEHLGRPLIVMEYVDGGSVYERLRRGRVQRDEALRWLGQVAEALDRAHAHGVVHRDVKPANLLLDSDGNVHVSDFGIASATGADTLTAAGTVLGTAGYLSPEQARGEQATAASDRYALGVVAFELLTGRRPFSGDTPTTEAFAHLHAEVPSATVVDPTLPSGIDAVFQRALAKDPDLRPASARALVAELRASLAPSSHAPAPTLVSPGEPTRQIVYRSRRPRGLIAAVAATALLVLAFVGAAVLTGGGDGETRRPQSRGTTSTTSDSSANEASAEPEVDGVALNAEGFALIQAGDYARALPLLRAAVVALNGSGELTEAYASYNLAFARFATGRCDGVIGLLDRSERIQGDRKEIDELRREWQARCAPADEADDEGDGRPGKGKGSGKGKGDND